MSNFNSENFVKKFGFSILDAIVYSVLGSIISVAIIDIQMSFSIHTIKEFFGAKQQIIVAGPNCSPRYSLGLLWALLGLFIPIFIGDLFLEKSTNLFSRKWIFVVIISSILPIIFAVNFLPFLTDNQFEVDFNCFFWIFLALMPFTFFYAKFPLLIERFRNKNSLK
ncbi:MAG: hypothetical protein MUC29_13165 [Pyrinomonadaceae bacterium]|nr:hypothetical protein [Pyrinomonadaceae bacterium]